jgi:hypothetical protein
VTLPKSFEDPAQHPKQLVQAVVNRPDLILNVRDIEGTKVAVNTYSPLQHPSSVLTALHLASVPCQLASHLKPSRALSKIQCCRTSLPAGPHVMQRMVMCVVVVVAAIVNGACHPFPARKAIAVLQGCSHFKAALPLRTCTLWGMPALYSHQALPECQLRH